MGKSKKRGFYFFSLLLKICSHASFRADENMRRELERKPTDKAVGFLSSVRFLGAHHIFNSQFFFARGKEKFVIFKKNPLHAETANNWIFPLLALLGALIL